MKNFFCFWSIFGLCIYASPQTRSQMSSPLLPIEGGVLVSANSQGSGAVETSPVDKETQSAVAQTQELMRNQKERAKALKGDAKAQEADSFAAQAVGNDSAKKDELYDISAELLPWVMEQAQGDPAKANELLLEAMKNPAAFVKRMPAAQQERIESIATKNRLKKNQP